jgi:hypothetical protein
LKNGKFNNKNEKSRYFNEKDCGMELKMRLGY